MEKFKVLIIGLFVAGFVILALENAGLRNQLGSEKARSKALDIFGTETFETLNHTLAFLETTEHAMNNYKRALQSCEEQVPSFQSIAKQIASEHEWIADEYDCSQFSYDLTIALRQAGYDAHTQTGYWHYIDGETCSEFDKEHWNCKHEWVMVRVFIEATTGEIIEPKTYEREYK